MDSYAYRPVGADPNLAVLAPTDVGLRVGVLASDEAKQWD